MRLLMLIAAAALLAFALLGCSSESGPGDESARFTTPELTVPTPAPQPSATAAPAPTPTPTPVPSADEGAAPSAKTSESGESAGFPVPEFTLGSATGDSISLSDLLEGKNGAVVVFYRGFF